MKKEENKVEIFVTKYCLTTGIYKKVGTLNSSSGLVQVKEEFGVSFYHRCDYEFTKELAIKKANEMKKKKIASLIRQLHKIEVTEFR